MSGRIRMLLNSIGAAAALGLVAVPTAGAAEEIGDRCPANDVLPNSTVLVLNNAIPDYSVLPPVVPPEGAKVITRWKANAPAGVGPSMQQLVVAKQVGEEDDLLVGASAPEVVVGGAPNEFATRVPVPEYAHIGMRGSSSTLVCTQISGHLGGTVEGPWAIGEQRRHLTIGKLGVPVTAIVEPDRDADGYGDETQDACPRSAAHFGPCPVLAFTAKGRVKRNQIVVAVKSSETAEIRVAGQARWQLRKPNGKVVKVTKPLSFGIKKVVSPQSAGEFSLPLPTPVLNRLEQIKPNQHLGAVVVALAYDLNRKAVLRKFQLRIPGRG